MKGEKGRDNSLHLLWRFLYEKFSSIHETPKPMEKKISISKSIKEKKIKR